MKIPEAPGCVGLIYQPDTLRDVRGKVAKGAFVKEVYDRGPAMKAGFRITDFITAMDGRPLKNSDSWRELFALRRPGETVRVSLRIEKRVLVPIKKIYLGSLNNKANETHRCELSINHLELSKTLEDSIITRIDCLWKEVPDDNIEGKHKYVISDEAEIILYSPERTMDLVTVPCSDFSRRLPL